MYAIKRHATTRTAAPVFGVFSEYVVGLAEYGKRVKQEDKKLQANLPPTTRDKPFLDFRQWPLDGATAPDNLHLGPAHQRQVSTVEILDGHDLPGAGALGG